MLFLPASFVSSIFGMGFFNTSPGADGQPVLLISRDWWLYVAVSVPLTVLCLLVLGGFNVASKTMKKRSIRHFDLEKVASEQNKED